MRRLTARHARLGPIWMCFALAAVSAWPDTAAAQVQNKRETQVRGDIAKFEADESWVYNDWYKAVAEAKKSGKPLMVILRCVPCEACSEFDDQLVRRVDEVRDLMDQFVCARIITTNGLDLDLFQFDYDQSFHAFLMNADGTVYGRFGTRSESRDETQDMTMQGFRRALATALTWHQKYPENKQLFTAKRGPKPLVAHPEDYPILKATDRYKSELDYTGNIVQSCIHCHQVREAERHFYRDAGKPIPEDVLYPYPLPKVIGLTMNAEEACEVKAVASGSPAAEAGLRAGDTLIDFGGQPLLSIADLQWVLHRAPSKTVLPVGYRRGRDLGVTEIRLSEGWRAKSDLSWRVTTWDLRRAAFGGMKLDDVPDEERSSLKLGPDALALRAEHVGQYGAHAKAKQAGFQKGDVIVEVDGARTRMTETQLLAKNLAEHKPGESVPVKVVRGGREVSLQLPIQ